MKRYLRAYYGVTASLTVRRDGTARLIIRDGSGRKCHDRIHKNERAAMAAWYRANN